MRITIDLVGTWSCVILKHQTRVTEHIVAERKRIERALLNSTFSLYSSFYKERVFLKSSIFSDIKPYSPVKVNRRFGGSYRLYREGRRVSQVGNNQQQCALFRLHFGIEYWGDTFRRLTFTELRYVPITVALRSKHELSSLARTLRSWVRIPLKTWMFMCVFILCLCCSVCR
jgi:hypothetical protein